MKQYPHQWFRGIGLLCLLLPLLGACQEKDDTVMLGIVGYNYTDRYIDRFSVHGAGGSNVNKSRGDSGGGSTVCCIGYNPKRPLPIPMKVEWVFGYQIGPDGEITIPDEYHETTALLSGPVPGDPSYLEVHFMPDGTVQIMITADHSGPLLNIDRSAELAASVGDGND